MFDEKKFNAIIEEWMAKGIEKVRFELPDLHGGVRCKIVPLRNARGYAQKGLNMYGGTLALDSASSVVPGSLYNEEKNYADQKLFPDLDTAAVVPWADKTARFICDTYWDDGTPLRAAPRYVLKKALAELDALGLEAKVGLEFEFYLLDGKTRDFLFGGVHIFNPIRNTYVPVIEEIISLMPEIGIDIITANCEYAPSQYEINYKPETGLKAADAGFTFKNGVKALAHRAGLLATFMTKPYPDKAGCGAHIHVSLLDKRTGENVFLDKSDPYGISDLCRYFIYGQLEHAPAVMALMVPTYNCYKRYKPHTFAPSNVSWGFEDRSAMIRVKSSFDERTHIENRLPSGIANPYLIVAACLAAGVLGIQSRKAPEMPHYSGPAEECPDLPKLPRNLETSLQALEADPPLCNLLGEEFVKVFTTVKRYELQRLFNYVTDWERNEYMELY
ncbi:MAG: glutamine synthetase family protein [Desulfotomaculales bacterium]